MLSTLLTAESIKHQLHIMHSTTQLQVVDERSGRCWDLTVSKPSERQPFTALQVRGQRYFSGMEFKHSACLAVPAGHSSYEMSLGDFYVGGSELNKSCNSYGILLAAMLCQCFVSALLSGHPPAFCRAWGRCCGSCHCSPGPESRCSRQPTCASSQPATSQ